LAAATQPAQPAQPAQPGDAVLAKVSAWDYGASLLFGISAVVMFVAGVLIAVERKLNQ
jgi:hypothetical protein